MCNRVVNVVGGRHFVSSATCLRRDSHGYRNIGEAQASTVLHPRVLIATAVLNPPLVSPLIPYLVMPALVAALTAALGMSKPAVVGAPNLPLDNPLQLRAAIQMAILSQGVLMVVYLAREMWGQSGVLTSAAILGLTDVDALTVSMARGVANTVSLETAALAIAIGVLANTALKLGLALIFGSARFRMIVGGTLVLMIIAAAAALVLPLL